MYKKKGKQNDICEKKQNGYIGESVVLSNASAQNAKCHMDAWIRRIVLIVAGKC